MPRVRSFVIALAIVALAGPGAGPPRAQEQRSLQEQLDNLAIETLTSDWLESNLGGEYTIVTGETLVEGYRDGKLDALCSPSALAHSPTDRAMDLGKSRTANLFVYANLGLTFVFLDHPWTIWKIRLTDAALSWRGVSPGASFAEANPTLAQPPRLARRSENGDTCYKEWDDFLVVASCPAAEREGIVQEVVILNPELPSGCWLSYRGMK